MAQVIWFLIDGKQYRMAARGSGRTPDRSSPSCSDRYVLHLEESFGEIGDQRLTVMAGIMVMDELRLNCRSASRAWKARSTLR